MKNEAFVDEVLRKIGRNVVLFQQLEQLLKFIVAHGTLAGPARAIATSRQEQEQKVNKQTMGSLVGHYIENAKPTTIEPQVPENPVDDFVSFRFHEALDDADFSNRKKALEDVVSERNDLIHHLLPRFDINSAESCAVLGQQLDRQADNVRLQINEFHTTANALYQGREHLRDYLQSEKGRKEIELSFIRQSKLVLLLVDVATQTKREDGWTLLSAAGDIIKRHAPEQLERMKERFGYSALMEFVRATELFDLDKEATPNGGARILYRLKAGVETSVSH